MVKKYLVFLKIPAGSTIWNGPGATSSHYNTSNEEKTKTRRESLLTYLTNKSQTDPVWIRAKGAFEVELDESIVAEIKSLPIVRRVQEQGES